MTVIAGLAHACVSLFLDFFVFLSVAFLSFFASFLWLKDIKGLVQVSIRLHAIVLCACVFVASSEHYHRPVQTYMTVHVIVENVCILDFFLSVSEKVSADILVYMSVCVHVFACVRERACMYMFFHVYLFL